MSLAMQTVIEELAQCLGYPDGVPSGATSFTFVVDNMAVKASLMSDGRLLLRHDLGYLGELGEVEPGLLLERLAGMALGRSLREDAVLSFDPQDEAVFLWQVTDATRNELVEVFSQFLNCAEWWGHRVTEVMAPRPVFPDMVIRP